jgi:hypothetical protein
LVTDQKISDPNWLGGFTSGEGCFFVNINKSKTKLSVSVSLTFKLTQDVRDEQLMNSLIEYYGCGKYYFSSGRRG